MQSIGKQDQTIGYRLVYCNIKRVKKDIKNEFEE